MDDELLLRSAAARAKPLDDDRLGLWRTAAGDNEQRSRAVEEVLRLTAAADDELDFGPAPTGEKLLGKSRVADERGRRHSRPWRASLLAAAAVATLMIGVTVAQRVTSTVPPAVAAGFGPGEFQTESQPATVGLTDGSVVRLAPATRLRVHERSDAREVSLVGRGYFAVTHDAAAPFTIRTDAGTVTVLGTRFDVSVTGDDLRLIVVEGEVRLTVRGSSVSVHSGQLAQVLRGNLVQPIDVPDPVALIDWVGDFVVFQDTQLRTVAREVEQRHGVRFEFSDPALGERAVTALFAGRSFDEIAEVICVVTNLRCTRAGDVLRMTPAP